MGGVSAGPTPRRRLNPGTKDLVASPLQSPNAVRLKDEPQGLIWTMGM